MASSFYEVALDQDHLYALHLKVSYKQTGLSDIYRGVRVAQQARCVAKTAVARDAHLYESCCHSIINKYGYKQ